jgi:hypothetical protein
MIYINHDKKYIFIRTAKTASTSILAYLSTFNDYSPFEVKYPYDQKHIPSIFIKNNFPDYFNNYYKFAFIRNPWSRMVSTWKMNMVYHRNTPDFKKYIKSIPTFEWMPDKGNHEKTPREVWLHKYSSMYEFTRGCNFIGKFENLQQDFNIVCDKIGIPKQQLRHENKTIHKHYSEYYDEETKQIVAEKYAKDIEYFNYKFEG